MIAAIGTSDAGGILAALTGLRVTGESVAPVYAVSPDEEQFVVTNVSRDSALTINYSSEAEQPMNAGALVAALTSVESSLHAVLWGPDGLGYRDAIASVKIVDGKVLLTLPAC